MNTYAKFVLPLYGVSFFGGLPVMYNAWQEPESLHRTAFLTAMVGDETTTAMHAGGTAMLLQATNAQQADNVVLASAKGVTAQFVFKWANVAQMATAGAYFVDQVILYAQTGEWDYGVLSMCASNFAMGMTQFVRAVQALDDIEKASGADAIYKITMGAITSEKLMWLRGVAKLFLGLGIAANLYLVNEALKTGDNWKVASAALGLASNICFLIGIPELAAGPLAPIGGSWCIAGYALITLQFLIDNREYLQEKFDDACAIGAEAWQDLLTQVSDYDEIKAASANPLHLLNLKRSRLGLHQLTADSLLAGLAAYGVNEVQSFDSIVGEDQFYNFQVLKKFTEIENQYLELVKISSGIVSDSEKIKILAEIYAAYLALKESPKAQAAFLVLLGPLILENQKFAGCLAASQVGQSLQTILNQNFYVYEFKAIFFNQNEEYFEFVAKTKLRTQAWQATKSWANDQVNIYFTDVWTMKQLQIWGDDYLAYWDRLQNKNGFDTHSTFYSMIAQMKSFGVDRFDQDYIGQQNQRSVRILSDVVHVLQRMSDEVKNPSEQTKLEILGGVYNTWHETLRGNPQAQAAYLVLLEPVLFANSRYQKALQKYAWGQSLAAEAKSKEAVEFKKQLGIYERPNLQLAFNGQMQWSLSPNSPQYKVLSEYGITPPDTISLNELPDFKPESVDQNWQLAFKTSANTSLDPIKSNELDQLAQSLVSINGY